MYRAHSPSVHCLNCLWLKNLRLVQQKFLFVHDTSVYIKETKLEFFLFFYQLFSSPLIKQNQNRVQAMNLDVDVAQCPNKCLKDHFFVLLCSPLKHKILHKQKY